MPIDPITLAGTGRALKQGAQPGPSSTAAGGFGESLRKLIDGVEQSEADANTAVNGMLDKSTDVHDAMIALQRSELTFELTLQIRNKFVSAYQDIMRMPI